MVLLDSWVRIWLFLRIFCSVHADKPVLVSVFPFGERQGSCWWAESAVSYTTPTYCKRAQHLSYLRLKKWQWRWNVQYHSWDHTEIWHLTMFGKLNLRTELHLFLPSWSSVFCWSDFDTVSFRYGGSLQSVDRMLWSRLQGSAKSTATCLQWKSKLGNFSMWNTMHWVLRR